MRKRINAIYKATNTVNGMCYVGQTIFTLSSRKAGHKRKALKDNKSTLFYKAIREHGFDAFTWEVVCECNTPEELDEKEREVIKMIGVDKCYNLCTGGKTNFKFPESTKKLLSIQKMGSKNPMYGRSLSVEEKEALLKASMEVCEKRVGKLSEDGYVIEEYKSLSECARQNNCSVSSISNHANGKLRSQRYVFL